jgi:DNA polymerase elongation subunit (family B)
MSLVHCDHARDLVQFVNGYAHVDETKLDIFSTTAKSIPLWEPTHKPTPYAELSKVIIDIETLRINNALKDIRQQARENRLMSIGVRNEHKRNLFITDTSEAVMLQTLFEILDEKQPDLILTFNGMWFDLPFIVERARVLGIHSPFWIDYERPESRFAAAVIAGRPYQANFRAVHCKFRGKKAHHIDTYMLAVAFDAVMRKLTKYSLKSIPVEIGLRKEERLDLGIEGIERCYQEGDWDTLHEYLAFDLEDTHLLADRFVPDVINQHLYFPGFTTQSLATIGNGTKWNAAISEHYSAEYIDSLGDPTSNRYQGALTIAKAGFYQDIVSFDFSGQYPTCMMQYGINSERDPECWGLARMKHAMDYRNSIKYMKNPTDQDLEFVTTVKSVVNSAYGALAAKIPFGDSTAAALVTAFARARLRWSIEFVEKIGGRVVLSDTDSLYIIAERDDIHLHYPINPDTLKELPPNASGFMLSAVAIGEELRRNIPSGAKLDLDSINRIFFVPTSTVPSEYKKNYPFKSQLAKRYITKILGDESEYWQYAVDNFPDEIVAFDGLKKISDFFGLGFPDYQGIKKNYIKLVWSAKKQAYELKAKGKFSKRDRTKFEKNFQKEFITHWVKDPAIAEQFYLNYSRKIASGMMPTEQIKVTRKIRKGEKKLIELGFGQERDIVSFYMGANGEYVESGAYDVSYYIKKLDRMYEEIKALMEHSK